MAVIPGRMFTTRWPSVDVIRIEENFYNKEYNTGYISIWPDEIKE